MKNKKKHKLKRKNFFKEEYIKSWNYLKESKRFIFLIIGIFILFALLGFFIPVSENFSAMIFEYLQKILAESEGLSGGGMIWFLFSNNIQSSFFSMIFGFLFGLLPLIATLINGYVLGFVSLLAVQENGFGILWRLAPHGIFELPAIFISLGLGLKFGSFILKKDVKSSFKRYLWESLRVFVFVILPLLVIAAIIEGLLISFGN